MSATGLDVFDRTLQTTNIAVLDAHITKGQAEKVASCLPANIRALWPSAGEPTEPASEVENTTAARV